MLLALFAACSTPSDSSLSDTALDDTALLDDSDTDLLFDDDDDDDDDDFTEEDDASVLVAGLPTTMRCGEARTAQITMVNQGYATWTADAYRLGGVDDDDPFATTRHYLPDGVLIRPGESFTFTFGLVAPSSPGQWVTDWRMVHEHVRWFGDTASETVTVEC